MNTLTDFVDVKKMLNHLILGCGSTIVMIREHTGISADRIYQLIAHDKKATNKEAYEIFSLLYDILKLWNLNITAQERKKNIVDYLTSEKIISKKKETVNAVFDMLDAGYIEYGQIGLGLTNHL